jgi:hypothetical protein
MGEVAAKWKPANSIQQYHSFDPNPLPGNQSLPVKNGK